MKKILTIIAVVAMMATVFTGCGDKDKDKSDNLASENGIINDESNTMDNDSDHNIIDDAGSAIDDIEDDAESFIDSIGEGAESIADDIGEAVAHPFKKFVDPLIEKADELELPMLTEVTDETVIQDFFKLDKNNPNYKDIMVMQCPMSGSLGEIIIIEAQDGKVDEVKKDLEARKEKLINTDAFYPDHKAIAEKAVINSSGNYVYFIASTKSTEVEKELKAELEK